MTLNNENDPGGWKRTREKVGESKCYFVVPDQHPHFEEILRVINGFPGVKITPTKCFQPRENETAMFIEVDAPGFNLGLELRKVRDNYDAIS